MKKLNLFLAALAMITTLSLSAQTYTLNSDKSSLQWTGSKITGEHYGEVNVSEGSLVSTDGKLSGEFTIDMTSIDVQDLEGEMKGKLEGHLASEDFFNVAGYNTATIKITKIRPVKPAGDDAPNHVVTGDLTIKGITHQIEFPAKITYADRGMTADASFSIDRTKWEIRYGSGSLFDGLGDKMIYDDIELELTIVASKAETMEVKPSVAPEGRPKNPFGSKKR